MTTTADRTIRRHLNPGRGGPNWPSSIPMQVHLFVTHENGQLRISGVEGPTLNGDARGSSGQCLDSLLNLETLNPGWDVRMVQKLHDIWEKWHLNDGRPFSPEMRAAGWVEGAKVKVYRRDAYLDHETSEQIKKMGADFHAAAAEGHAIIPTAEQIRLARLPRRCVVTWLASEPKEPRPPKGYRWSLSQPHSELTTLGLLRPDQHPRGLLGRKLRPADSHGYGDKWWHEDVPEKVLDFLQNLPRAEAPLKGTWKPNWEETM